MSNQLKNLINHNKYNNRRVNIRVLKVNKMVLGIRIMETKMLRMVR